MKIKHLLLTLLPLLVAASSLAQEKAAYYCLYDYSIQQPAKETEHYNCILQIAPQFALFSDYAAFQLDSLQQTSAPEEQKKAAEDRLHKETYYFDQTVYQNQPKGKLRVLSPMTPNFFSYEEDNNSIQWQLSNATDTICGYLCKQATADYGGRKWTAWYAPEIPLAFGPWKMQGLPGLVMKVTDSENIHQFQAIQFSQATGQIIHITHPEPIATTRKDFVKAKNKFEKDPLHQINPQSLTEVQIFKTADGANSYIFNGVQLRIRPNGYTPLEKE